MRKYLVCIFITTLTASAYAITTTPTSCFYNSSPSDTGNCAIINRLITCGSAQYHDCQTCKDGSTPTEKSVKISSYETITYNDCPLSFEPIGGECPSECPDRLAWSDVSGANYQTICGGTLLNPSCKYRCKQGYYGTDKSCTRCPSSGGVYGTTADAGATAITECYIPSGTAFSDTSGSGTYTGDCYYQN